MVRLVGIKPKRERSTRFFAPPTEEYMYVDHARLSIP
jgi:hypothetical protein